MELHTAVIATITFLIGVAVGALSINKINNQHVYLDGFDAGFNAGYERGANK